MCARVRACVLSTFLYYARCALGLRTRASLCVCVCECVCVCVCVCVREVFCRRWGVVCGGLGERLESDACLARALLLRRPTPAAAAADKNHDETNNAPPVVPPPIRGKGRRVGRGGESFCDRGEKRTKI